MKIQIKIFIAIIGVFLVLLFLGFFQENISARTDKKEYQLGENLKIEIKNNSPSQSAFLHVILIF